MPELLLPSTTYQPPSPLQARGHGRSLNTIMEEDDEDNMSLQLQPQLPASFSSHPRKREPPPAPTAKFDSVEQWLSPQSDNFPTPKGFPTPRGMHYMAMPILSSPHSRTSVDDCTSTRSPATQSNPWNRASVVSEVTEFDDLYELTESENDEAEEPFSSHDVVIKHCSSNSHSVARIASTRSSCTKRKRSSVESRKSLPRLAITSQSPSQADEGKLAEQWSQSPGGMPDLKALTSPIVPTPTTTVEMSPAVRHFMQQHHHTDLPAISTPPSLDGSLSSEQLAMMSAPPTPIIGSNADDTEEWGGVQLQPGAMATLNALSGGEFVHHDDAASDDHHHEHPTGVIEFDQPGAPMEMRQQPSRISDVGMSTNSNLSPEQRQSLEGLTRLEIPSPGGFFAALSPRARHTWHMPGMTPDDIVPPTSTTAEQFYRTPWNNPSPALSRMPPFPSSPSRKTSPLVTLTSAPIEHVIQVDEDDLYDEDNVPTAKPTIASVATEPSSASEASEPKEEVVATEIIVDYDPQYARKQQEVALSNLDRTEMWLTAQKAYMSGIAEGYSSSSSSSSCSCGEDTEQADTEAETTDAESELPPAVPPKSPPPPIIKDTNATKKDEAKMALSPPQRKKTVRFSEPPKPLPTSTSEKFPVALPSKFGRTEGTYYRAFQDALVRAHGTDAMINSMPRFESVQASRVALVDAHRDQLLGKYQLKVLPQSAKKRMSANVARADHELVEDPDRLRKEKETEAGRQLAPASWAVGAQKSLMGGRLLISPAGKKLARQSMCLVNGKYRGDRLRILDFGGMSTADWAWHAAHAYPNTKIYTAMLRSQRQLSNANVRGPPNHRTIKVPRLTKLPFPDAFFDVVSAREMQSMLHFSGENGADEWEGAIKEIMRVLKPGGYFEFNLMDSDIVNPGPEGNAKSVEFGFVLSTLGYDPNPTRSFLGRLDRLGFEGLKRMWTILPMGAKPTPTLAKLKIPIRESSLGTEFRECKLEAMVQGSTDAAAPMTGLLGSWVWERWLLRAEMERVAGKLRLADMCTGKGERVKEAARCLDGVATVFEEGRRNSSGWRCLIGYASKPVVPAGHEDGVIPLALQL